MVGNIANSGAIFREKSVMESMACVHCKTVEVEVRPPLWGVQPAEAGGILRYVINKV